MFKYLALIIFILISIKLYNEINYDYQLTDEDKEMRIMLGDPSGVGKYPIVGDWVNGKVYRLNDIKNNTQ